jgi:hypothetical protein
MVYMNFFLLLDMYLCFSWHVWFKSVDGFLYSHSFLQASSVNTNFLSPYLLERLILIMLWKTWAWIGLALS